MKSGLLLISFLFFFCTGCGIYSFTGASIPPDIKTISIEYFPNHAPLVQPSLSQLFTESLKEKFLTQTNLTLVERNGDMMIEGAITDYNTQPVAIQGNETTALNRLTIAIKVRFINNKDEKQNFETTFSRYKDYDSKISLTSIEAELIKQINEQLIDDIFNKAVINW